MKPADPCRKSQEIINTPIPCAEHRRRTTSASCIRSGTLMLQCPCAGVIASSPKADPMSLVTVSLWCFNVSGAGAADATLCRASSPYRCARAPCTCHRPPQTRHWKFETYFLIRLYNENGRQILKSNLEERPQDVLKLIRKWLHQHSRVHSHRVFARQTMETVLRRGAGFVLSILGSSESTITTSTSLASPSGSGLN